MFLAKNDVQLFEVIFAKEFIHVSNILCGDVSEVRF